MGEVSNKQLFHTIVDQVIEYIALDIFEQGTMIISVRAYAQSLGINPNTVQKAYQKLEELGHIVSIEKKGSFVKDAAFTKKQYEKTLFKQFQLITKKMNYTTIKKNQLTQWIDQIFKEENENVEDESCE